MLQFHEIFKISWNSNTVVHIFFIALFSCFLAHCGAAHCQATLVCQKLTSWRKNLPWSYIFSRKKMGFWWWWHLHIRCKLFENCFHRKCMQAFEWSFFVILEFFDNIWKNQHGGIYVPARKMRQTWLYKMYFHLHQMIFFPIYCSCSRYVPRYFYRPVKMEK